MNFQSLNPFRWGVISLAMALVMLATDTFYRPVFVIKLTGSFSLHIWILFAVFGGLQLLLWRATRNSLTLSDAEVTQWGARLEAATPAILEQAKARTPVRDIAAAVEEAHGIPVDVTLRYIIALGHQAVEPD